MRTVVLAAFLSLTFLPTVHAQAAMVDIASTDADRLLVSRIVGWHREPFRDIHSDRYGTYAFWNYRDVPDTTAVCTAPCRASVATGRQRFILTDSIGGMFTESVVVEPGSTLLAHIERRGAYRTAGHWILLLGFLGSSGWAGWILTEELLRLDQDSTRRFDLGSPDEVTGLLGSAGVFLGSLVVGLAIACLNDTASLEVIPGGVRF